MSFLDERDNPQRTRGAADRGAERRSNDGARDRPRRSGSSGGRPPRPGRGTDSQTLLIRRSLAIGAGVVVLVLMVLLVRGCLDARKQRAYEDYFQEVSSLVAESETESETLFELLQDPGDLSPVDVQNQINGFSVDAQRLGERGEAVDAPDELSDIHALIVLTLDLRRDGLEGVAASIPAALGEEQRSEANEAIADEMRTFLASDVVYGEQAEPRIEQALEQEELADAVAEVPDSRFLPGVEWLDPATVSEAVARISGEEQTAGGVSGTGLAGVTVMPAGLALSSDAATEIATGGELALDVQIENQGESDEQDVFVEATVEGGAEPLTVEGSLDAIAAGTTETVSLPLEQTPPTDEELTLVVSIEPVEGEQDAENNEASYPVVFSE